jgi:hypothetical protein
MKITEFVKAIKKLPVYKNWKKQHQNVIFHKIGDVLLLIRKENLMEENNHLRAICWSLTSELERSVGKFEKRMESFFEPVWNYQGTGVSVSPSNQKPYIKTKSNGFVKMVNATYIPDGYYWGYDYYVLSLSGKKIRQGDIADKRWDKRRQIKNVPLISIRGKYYLRIGGDLVDGGQGVFVKE